MRRFALAVSLVAASAATLTVASPRAHACSPAFDWAPEPDAELDYDASRAPAAPEPVAAEVRHLDGPGGCGTADCGGTFLFVELADVPEPARVRVTYPGGRVEYAEPWDQGDGVRFQLGWNSYELPATLTLETVTDEGYPSLPVTVEAVAVAEEGSGCAVSSELPSPGALCVAAAVLLGLSRRRRR